MNEEEYKIHSLVSIIKQGGRCLNLNLACFRCGIRYDCSGRSHEEKLSFAKKRLAVYPQHIIFEALL